jgi:hypothetical protein
LKMRFEHLKCGLMDVVGPFHLGTYCLRHDVWVIN